MERQRKGGIAKRRDSEKEGLRKGGIEQRGDREKEE